MLRDSLSNLPSSTGATVAPDTDMAARPYPAAQDRERKDAAWQRRVVAEGDVDVNVE